MGCVVLVREGDRGCGMWELLWEMMGAQRAALRTDHLWSCGTVEHAIVGRSVPFSHAEV